MVAKLSVNCKNSPNRINDSSSSVFKSLLQIILLISNSHFGMLDKSSQSQASRTLPVCRDNNCKVFSSDKNKILHLIICNCIENARRVVLADWACRTHFWPTNSDMLLFWSMLLQKRSPESIPLSGYCVRFGVIPFYTEISSLDSS